MIWASRKLLAWVEKGLADTSPSDALPSSPFSLHLPPPLRYSPPPLEGELLLTGIAAERKPDDGGKPALPPLEEDRGPELEILGIPGERDSTERGERTKFSARSPRSRILLLSLGLERRSSDWILSSPKPTPNMLDTRCRVGSSRAISCKIGRPSGSN